MAFDIAALAARYPRDRISTAANATDEAVGALLGDDEPAHWTPEDRAGLAALRARVETAIADAVGTVSAALAGRYDWREVEDHRALRRPLADATLYNLYNDVIPEDMENRHKHAMRRLERLASGSELLTDPATGDPIPRRDAARSASSGAQYRDGATPLFRRSDLAGY